MVFGCAAYYMNKPVGKRQSPWKRGRGDSTSAYTPQEWYQKMSWVEEKAIRSSLQEPDSDSESEKRDAEAASASKPHVPVIDVDSLDEQSLDEIPDALAWLNDIIQEAPGKALQRKRIRTKRPPQPVPVPKARPMTIEDVAPPEESAPGAPEAPDADTNVVRLLQRRLEIFRLRLLFF